MAEIIASGDYWRLEDDGTLYVYFVGAMSSYAWSSYKSDIVTVVISDSVSSISNYAFKNCGNLADITIGGGVASIGDYAFENCVSLTSVTIPDNVTTVGQNVFRDCAGLTSAKIGDGMSYVGDCMFYGCVNLASVSVGDNVTNIKYSAFNHCSALSDITIPQGLANIGDNAFFGCDNLSDIYYAGTEEEWAAITVGNYNAPLSSATIRYVLASGDWWRLEKGGTLSIFCVGEMSQQDRFYTDWHDYKDTIVSVVIYPGVTNILMDAFSGCENLQNVTIPDSVTRIDGYAFQTCPRLESVDIPASVTNIYDYAFADCDALQSVRLSGPVGLGFYVFHNCVSLKTFSFPDGTQSVGPYTFYGCAALERVDIPESVTYIDGAAFAECESLADVYYGGSKSQWKQITIEDGNDLLLNATIHYAKEDDPMSEESRNPQRVVYGVVPPNAFKQLILEAGVLVTEFDTATGEFDGFIGATSGGVSFNANPNDVDFGEDVDGAPANTMQLRRRVQYDPVLSGTLVSTDETTLKRLNGAADVEDLTADTNTANAAKTGLTPAPSDAPITSLKRVTPSEDILTSDFIPRLWLLADYTADHNPDAGAGCVAICLKNAFNTTGLQIQTQQNQKGTLPFEFHAHYDLTDITAVPFEIYVRNGPLYKAGT